MSEEKIIKVIIVDDHPVVRQGIKDIIEQEGSIKVICETDNANDAIDLLSKHEIDLAIIDITIKGNVNGVELVKAVKDRYPEINTLVLSMHNEALYAERSIRAGAKGYLMKEDAPKSIINAIYRIMEGDLFISEETSRRIVNKVVQGSSDSIGLNIDKLSNREFEIFRLIGNGFSSKEISKKLNLSVNTIESHRRNIREKMNFADSAEMVKNAIQWVIMQSTQ